MEIADGRYRISPISGPFAGTLGTRQQLNQESEWWVVREKNIMPSCQPLYVERVWRDAPETHGVNNGNSIKQGHSS
jgi:hypothetical protein